MGVDVWVGLGVVVLYCTFLRDTALDKAQERVAALPLPWMIALRCVALRLYHECWPDFESTTFHPMCV